MAQFKSNPLYLGLFYATNEQLIKLYLMMAISETPLMQQPDWLQGSLEHNSHKILLAINFSP